MVQQKSCGAQEYDWLPTSEAIPFQHYDLKFRIPFRNCKGETIFFVLDVENVFDLYLETKTQFSGIKFTKKSPKWLEFAKVSVVEHVQKPMR